MMQVQPMHQPVSAYQSFETAASQYQQAYTDHSWPTDEPIASATTTDAKIPTAIIPSSILNGMDTFDAQHTDGSNKTFFDYRSSADSAYGSPDNISNLPGDISPTTRLSPLTSRKASIDMTKRASHRSFHLPLDARASPRGSLSSNRGQKVVALLPPPLKTHASETALKDAYQKDSGLPHFQGPSPHVRRPSFPKNRLSRLDSLSNTFTETCCTTTHHATLERKMSLLEQKMEGLMPALSALTMAVNGLAASFENGTFTRHVSVQTLKPQYPKSRQPSSSTLAGQGSPLGSIFNINPFDPRPLGSVSEQPDPEITKRSTRNGSIQSRTLDATDSDDENNRKRIEAWRNRPRQQSRWDTETESETDESDSCPAPPLPTPAALPPKANLPLPPLSPRSTHSPPTMVPATSPPKQAVRKRSFASAAAAVMRAPLGKKPGLVMRLDQYRPSIALPSMQHSKGAEIPPLPTFCTPTQRYQHQAVPQSAPPHMDTFPSHVKNPQDTLSVPTKAGANLAVKPISLPPTPSGSFKSAFPNGTSGANAPKAYKPLPLAPSPSLTIQSPTPPTSMTPAPSTTSTPAPRAGWYFFYGPLIDANLLVELLQLPSLPILRPARVHGRSLKFFGPYPAAISHRVPLSSHVDGQAWYVPSAQMAAWLRQHEEEGFVEVGAEIEFLEDGSRDEEILGERPAGLVLGRMFEWRGDVNGLMDAPSI